MSRLAYGCLWFLTFAIPWANTVLIPGIGTIGRLAGFVTAPIGVLAILARGRARPLATFHVLAACFAIWIGLSSSWSVDQEATMTSFFLIVQLAAIPWLVWEHAWTPERRRNLLQAFVFGSYVSAIYMLMNFRAGITSRGGGELSVEETGRYTVEGFNPNSLGFLLVLALPMAWHLGLEHRNVILRWINRLYMPIGTVAILLTGSRSSLVILAVALLIVPLSLGRLSLAVKGGVLAVILASVIAAAIYVPPLTWARLSTTADEIQSGTLNERRIIWEAGMKLFPRHPIGGVGAGGFPQAVKPFLGYKIEAHNTYLSVLLEEGAVGFILFSLMFLSIYFHARSAPREERRFILVLLLTFAVGLVPRAWEFDKPTWLMFGLLLAPASAAVLVPHGRPAWPAHRRFPGPTGVGQEFPTRAQRG
jgi:O-antigen ligase